MKGLSSSLSAGAKSFILPPASLLATPSLSDVDTCFLSPVVSPRSSSPFQPQGITVTNGISANYYTDPETGFITDYFSYNPPQAPNLTTPIPTPLSSSSPFSNFKKLEITTNSSSSKTSSGEDDCLIDSPCYQPPQFHNIFPVIPISAVGETSAPSLVTVEKSKEEEKGSNMKKEVFLKAVHGLSDMLVCTCPNAELAAGDYMKLQIVIQNLEKLLEKSRRKDKSVITFNEENIRENVYKKLRIEAEVEKCNLYK